MRASREEFVLKNHELAILEDRSNLRFLFHPSSDQKKSLLSPIFDTFVKIVRDI